MRFIRKPGLTVLHYEMVYEGPSQKFFNLRHNFDNSNAKAKNPKGTTGYSSQLFSLSFKNTRKRETVWRNFSNV